MGETDWGKTRSCSDGGAVLSKSLIQLSVDRRGCVPSPLFYLRPIYGGANEDNGDLLRKVPCTHFCSECPWPCSRPPPTHASTGHSWTLMGKSGLVYFGVTALFPWFLVHPNFCLYRPRVCFPSSVWVLAALWWVNGDLLQEGLCHTQVCCTQSPCPCGRPQLTCTTTGDTQTFKDRTGSVQSLWGLWVLMCTRYVWALQVSQAGMGFDSKCNFTPPTIFLGLLLCPWTWVSPQSRAATKQDYWSLFTQTIQNINFHICTVRETSSYCLTIPV